MTEKFQEIYEFYYVPFWHQQRFIISISIIAGLVFLFIAYKVICFIKRGKKRTLALWEIAKEDLMLLNPVHLKTKDEFKIFYFKLSYLLKNYLSKHYKLDLEGKTDDEVEAYLDSKGIDKTLIFDFISILQGSKFIKFAGEEALPSKAKEDWDKAFTIIDYTKA